MVAIKTVKQTPDTGPSGKRSLEARLPATQSSTKRPYRKNESIGVTVDGQLQQAIYVGKKGQPEQLFVKGKNGQEYPLTNIDLKKTPNPTREEVRTALAQLFKGNGMSLDNRFGPVAPSLRDVQNKAQSVLSQVSQQPLVKTVVSTFKPLVQAFKPLVQPRSGRQASPGPDTARQPQSHSTKPSKTASSAAKPLSRLLNSPFTLAAQGAEVNTPNGGRLRWGMATVAGTSLIAVQDASGRTVVLPGASLLNGQVVITPGSLQDQALRAQGGWAGKRQVVQSSVWKAGPWLRGLTTAQKKPDLQPNEKAANVRAQHAGLWSLPLLTQHLDKKMAALSQGQFSLNAWLAALYSVEHSANTPNDAQRAIDVLPAVNEELDTLRKQGHLPKTATMFDGVLAITIGKQAPVTPSNREVIESLYQQAKPALQKKSQVTASQVWPVLAAAQQRNGIPVFLRINLKDRTVNPLQSSLWDQQLETLQAMFDAGALQSTAQLGGQSGKWVEKAYNSAGVLDANNLALRRQGKNQAVGGEMVLSNDARGAALLFALTDGYGEVPNGASPEFSKTYQKLRKKSQVMAGAAFVMVLGDIFSMAGGIGSRARLKTALSQRVRVPTGTRIQYNPDQVIEVSAPPRQAQTPKTPRTAQLKVAPAKTVPALQADTKTQLSQQRPSYTTIDVEAQTVGRVPFKDATQRVKNKPIVRLAVEPKSSVVKPRSNTRRGQTTKPGHVLPGLPAVNTAIVKVPQLARASSERGPEFKPMVVHTARRNFNIVLNEELRARGLDSPERAFERSKALRIVHQAETKLETGKFEAMKSDIQRLRFIRQALGEYEPQPQRPQRPADHGVKTPARRSSSLTGGTSPQAANSGLVKPAGKPGSQHPSVATPGRIKVTAPVATQSASANTLRTGQDVLDVLGVTDPHHVLLPKALSDLGTLVLHTPLAVPVRIAPAHGAPGGVQEATLQRGSLAVPYTLTFPDGRQRKSWHIDELFKGLQVSISPYAVLHAVRVAAAGLPQAVTVTMMASKSKSNSNAPLIEAYKAPHPPSEEKNLNWDLRRLFPSKQTVLIQKLNVAEKELLLWYFAPNKGANGLPFDAYQYFCELLRVTNLQAYPSSEAVTSMHHILLGIAQKLGFQSFDEFFDTYYKSLSANAKKLLLQAQENMAHRINAALAVPAKNALTGLMAEYPHVAKFIDNFPRPPWQIIPLVCPAEKPCNASTPVFIDEKSKTVAIPVLGIFLRNKELIDSMRQTNQKNSPKTAAVESAQKVYATPRPTLQQMFPGIAPQKLQMLDASEAKEISDWFSSDVSGGGISFFKYQYAVELLRVLRQLGAIEEIPPSLEKVQKLRAVLNSSAKKLGYRDADDLVEKMRSELALPYAIPLSQTANETAKELAAVAQNALRTKYQTGDLEKVIEQLKSRDWTITVDSFPSSNSYLKEPITVDEQAKKITVTALALLSDNDSLNKLAQKFNEVISKQARLVQSPNLLSYLPSEWLRRLEFLSPQALDVLQQWVGASPGAKAADMMMWLTQLAQLEELGIDPRPLVNVTSSDTAVQTIDTLTALALKLNYPPKNALAAMVHDIRAQLLADRRDELIELERQRQQFTTTALNDAIVGLRTTWDQIRPDLNEAMQKLPSINYQFGLVSKLEQTAPIQVVQQPAPEVRVRIDTFKDPEAINGIIKVINGLVAQGGQSTTAAVANFLEQKLSDWHQWTAVQQQILARWFTPSLGGNGLDPHLHFNRMIEAVLGKSEADLSSYGFEGQTAVAFREAHFIQEIAKAQGQKPEEFVKTVMAALPTDFQTSLLLAQEAQTTVFKQLRNAAQQKRLKLLIQENSDFKEGWSQLFGVKNGNVQLHEDQKMPPGQQVLIQYTDAGPVLNIERTALYADTIGAQVLAAVTQAQASQGRPARSNDATTASQATQSTDSAKTEPNLLSYLPSKWLSRLKSLSPQALDLLQQWVAASPESYAAEFDTWLSQLAEIEELDITMQPLVGVANLQEAQQVIASLRGLAIRLGYSDKNSLALLVEGIRAQLRLRSGSGILIDVEKNRAARIQTAINNATANLFSQQEKTRPDLVAAVGSLASIGFEFELVSQLEQPEPIKVVLRTPRTVQVRIDAFKDAQKIDEIINVIKGLVDQGGNVGSVAVAATTELLQNAPTAVGGEQTLALPASLERVRNTLGPAWWSRNGQELENLSDLALQALPQILQTKFAVRLNTLSGFEFRMLAEVVGNTSLRTAEEVLGYQRNGIGRTNVFKGLAKKLLGDASVNKTSDQIKDAWQAMVQSSPALTDAQYAQYEKSTRLFNAIPGHHVRPDADEVKYELAELSSGAEKAFQLICGAWTKDQLSQLNGYELRVLAEVIGNSTLRNAALALGKLQSYFFSPEGNQLLQELAAVLLPGSNPRPGKVVNLLKDYVKKSTITGTSAVSVPFGSEPVPAALSANSLPPDASTANAHAQTGNLSSLLQDVRTTLGEDWWRKNGADLENRLSDNFSSVVSQTVQALLQTFFTAPLTVLDSKELMALAAVVGYGNFSQVASVLKQKDTYFSDSTGANLLRSVFRKLLPNYSSPSSGRNGIAKIVELFKERVAKSQEQQNTVNALLQPFPELMQRPDAHDLRWNLAQLSSNGQNAWQRLCSRWTPAELATLPASTLRILAEILGGTGLQAIALSLGKMQQYFAFPEGQKILQDLAKNLLRQINPLPTDSQAIVAALIKSAQNTPSLTKPVQSAQAQAIRTELPASVSATTAALQNAPTAVDGEQALALPLPASLEVARSTLGKEWWGSHGKVLEKLSDLALQALPQILKTEFAVPLDKLTGADLRTLAEVVAQSDLGLAAIRLGLDSASLRTKTAQAAKDYRLLAEKLLGKAFVDEKTLGQIQTELKAKVSPPPELTVAQRENGKRLFDSMPGSGDRADAEDAKEQLAALSPEGEVGFHKLCGALQPSELTDISAYALRVLAEVIGHASLSGAAAPLRLHSQQLRTLAANETKIYTEFAAKILGTEVTRNKRPAEIHIALRAGIEALQKISPEQQEKIDRLFENMPGHEKRSDEEAVKLQLRALSTEGVAGFNTICEVLEPKQLEELTPYQLRILAEVIGNSVLLKAETALGLIKNKNAFANIGLARDAYYQLAEKLLGAERITRAAPGEIHGMLLQFVKNAKAKLQSQRQTQPTNGSPPQRDDSTSLAGTAAALSTAAPIPVIAPAASSTATDEADTKAEAVPVLATESLASYLAARKTHPNFKPLGNVLVLAHSLAMVVDAHNAESPRIIHLSPEEMLAFALHYQANGSPIQAQVAKLQNFLGRSETVSTAYSAARKKLNIGLRGVYQSTPSNIGLYTAIQKAFEDLQLDEPTSLALNVAGALGRMGIYVPSDIFLTGGQKNQVQVIRERQGDGPPEFDSLPVWHLLNQSAGAAQANTDGAEASAPSVEASLPAESAPDVQDILTTLGTGSVALQTGGLAYNSALRVLRETQRDKANALLAGVWQGQAIPSTQNLRTLWFPNLQAQHGGFVDKLVDAFLGEVLEVCKATAKQASAARASAAQVSGQNTAPSPALSQAPDYATALASVRIHNLWLDVLTSEGAATPKPYLVSLQHAAHNRSSALWALEELSKTGMNPNARVIWSSSPYLADTVLKTEVERVLGDRYTVVTSVSEFKSAMANKNPEKPLLLLISDTALADEPRLIAELAKTQQAPNAAPLFYIADQAERLSTGSSQRYKRLTALAQAAHTVALSTEPVGRSPNDLLTLLRFLGVPGVDGIQAKDPATVYALAAGDALLSNPVAAPTPRFLPLAYSAQGLQALSELAGNEQQQFHDGERLAIREKTPFLTQETLKTVEAGGKVLIATSYVGQQGDNGQVESEKEGARTIAAALEKTPRSDGKKLRVEVALGGRHSEVRQALLKRWALPAGDPQALDVLVLTAEAVQGDQPFAAGGVPAGGVKLLWANIPANPRDKAALLALADGAQVTMVMPYLTVPHGDSQDASRLQDLLLAEQNAQATTSGLAAEADTLVLTDRQRSRLHLGPLREKSPEQISQYLSDPKNRERYYKDNENLPGKRQTTKFLIDRIKQLASSATGEITLLDLGGGRAPLAPAQSKAPLPGATGYLPYGNYLVIDLAAPGDTLQVPANQYMEGDSRNALALLKQNGKPTQVDIATIAFALMDDEEYMKGQLVAASQVVKPGGTLLIAQPLRFFSRSGFRQFEKDMEAIGFTLTVKNVLITEYGKPGTVAYLEFVRTATPTPALLPDFKQR